MWIALDKQGWEDNIEIWADFLTDFERNFEISKGIRDIFEEKDISAYFLKIYLVIHEKFLLTNIKENKSTYPIYFINKILHFIIDCKRIKKISIKHKLIQFICKNGLLNDDFQMENIKLNGDSQYFGRYLISKHEIYFFWISTTTQFLRKCEKSHEQLRELNLFKKFIQRVNYVRSFMDNLSGNYPEEIFSFLYEISTYFYNGNNGKDLKLNKKILKIYYNKIMQLIMIHQYQLYFIDNALAFFTRASLVNENTHLFLENRDLFLSLCRTPVLRCQYYTLKLFLILSEKNCWKQLKMNDEFFKEAINTMMRYDSKDLKPLTAKLIPIFMKRIS